MPIAAWVGCGLALGDAVVEGSLDYAIRVALLTGTVAYLVYIGLAKPSLTVDPDGITIANVVHTNRIPFGSLVDVRVGGLTSVIVRTDRGERKFTSWNAPGVSRRLPSRQDWDHESETERVIRDYWDMWKRKEHESSTTVGPVRRLNSRRLAVAATLLILNIAIWLR